MAHEVGSNGINGNYGPQPAATAPVSSNPQADLSKEQVAWYFVESYYTTMSQTPEKLHLFFNKRSQLVSGVEEEKSSVAVGQKAIKERLSSLSIQDCKVRVTNVDSQASNDNIIIQVIGEMSNHSQPHRKFVQTFVLASQTNGYFVLNDIFRYIKEDEDEEETTQDEGVQADEQEEKPVATETVHVEASGTEEEVREQIEATIDEKLEDIKAQTESEDVPTTNGVTDSSSVLEAEDASVAAPEPEIEKAAEEETAKADLEPETPQDPLPSPKKEAETPAPPPASTSTPAAPPKPAVPKSWAQLAAGNQARAAAAAAPTPASASAPRQAQPTSRPAASQAPATAQAAAREASPDSNKEGSTGGWQTAGHDHARKPSRPANQQQSGDGRVRAFVKNVTEDVDADALKSSLSKFGEIVYFDVARQKKAAFVEFTTQAGFNAAVNANPHRVGNEDVWVEERRVAGGGFSRGGRGGGRGDFGQRGGRGGFVPRGRGGSGNVTPRGGRGGMQ